MALRAENAELKRRLGLDSQLVEAAVDGFPVRQARAQVVAPQERPQAGRATWGIRGSTLAQVADPNERVAAPARPVRRLRQRFGGRTEVGMEKRQVFDLPPMTVEVTEHQLIARRCACGATTCGTAPQGVSAPVQYGPRITAIVLYLYVGQFCRRNAPPKRWPSCSAPRCRRALSPRCPSAPPTGWTGSSTAPERNGSSSPPVPGSTRPGCA